MSEVGAKNQTLYSKGVLTNTMSFSLLHELMSEAVISSTGCITVLSWKRIHLLSKEEFEICSC